MIVKTITAATLFPPWATISWSAKWCGPESRHANGETLLQQTRPKVNDEAFVGNIESAFAQAKSNGPRACSALSQKNVAEPEWLVPGTGR
jgi:hypothetical protein